MLSHFFSHFFSWQECLIETPESVWVPSPLLGLLELGAAGILVVLSNLLDPSKPFLVPASIPLCLSRLHGVGCVDFWRHWNMLWPVLLCLVCIGGRSSMNLMVSVIVSLVVPSMTRSALCPALADLFVPLLWGQLRSQWHWAPHLDTVGRGGLVLCSNSHQDWQTFLTPQCCGFHVFSVGQHYVKVSQMNCSFGHSSIKCDCWHRFACCQCLCLV